MARHWTFSLMLFTAVLPMLAAEEAPVLNGARHAWRMRGATFSTGDSGSGWCATFDVTGGQPHYVSVRYGVDEKVLTPPEGVKIVECREVSLPGIDQALCTRWAYPCAIQHACPGYHGAEWHLQALRGAALIRVDGPRTLRARQGPPPAPEAAEPAGVTQQKLEMLLDLTQAFLGQRGTIHRYEVVDLDLAAEINGKSCPMVPRQKVNVRTPRECEGHAYVLPARVGDELVWRFRVTSSPLEMTVDTLTRGQSRPLPAVIVEIADVTWSTADALYQGYRWTTDNTGTACLHWGKLQRLAAMRLRVYPTGSPSVWQAESTSRPVQGMVFVRNGRAVEAFLDSWQRPSSPVPPPDLPAVRKAVIAQYEALYDPDFNDFFRGWAHTPSLQSVEGFFLDRANALVQSERIRLARRVSSIEETSDGVFEAWAVRYFQSPAPIPLARVLETARMNPYPSYGREEVKGDPTGEWSDEEARQLLLLCRAAVVTKEKALAAEVREKVDALLKRMTVASNPTHYELGKARVDKAIDSPGEWRGHAWAALLFWEASVSMSDDALRESALRQVRHLLETHQSNLRGALAYHAVRRSAEEEKDDALAAAAKSIRATTLGEWTEKCCDRGWLLDLLRTAEERFYPYEPF